jgi:hypothetical protein
MNLQVHSVTCPFQLKRPYRRRFRQLESRAQSENRSNKDRCRPREISGQSRLEEFAVVQYVPGFYGHWVGRGVASKTHLVSHANQLADILFRLGALDLELNLKPETFTRLGSAQD